MHWGHAVSRDLLHWQHLPIALSPDENGMIFSGSVVIDRQDTAGFGRETMVAIFTHHKDVDQGQSLAYSHDEGLTWQKYPGNPVLPSPGNRDFRDPKVFWHEDHWVMCLAAGKEILFYLSRDLIRWERSGRFGGYGSTAGVWETPDLFRLPADRPSETHWVLTVSVGNGGPAGGSGTQYFIGQFDGKTFVSENDKDTLLWADVGADYYAPQSWNDEPNGRRLMIGWMSNWSYAGAVPAQDWRGSFSLIRELSLQRTDEGLRLVQRPILELQALRRTSQHWQNQMLRPGNSWVAEIDGNAVEILADVQLMPAARRLELRLCDRAGGQTTLRYSAAEHKLCLDRSRSGRTDFHPDFAHLQPADLKVRDGRLRLQIFVDQSSLEVFAHDGQLVMTNCLFPAAESTHLRLCTEGGSALLHSLHVFQLACASSKIKEVLPC